jgi:hypothetical protein
MADVHQAKAAYADPWVRHDLLHALLHDPGERKID